MFNLWQFDTIEDFKASPEYSVLSPEFRTMYTVFFEFWKAYYLTSRKYG